jgi:hypothetical protein
MIARYIIAVIGEGLDGTARHLGSLNRIGITDEDIGSPDLLWCTFDWGYSALRRTDLLFLRPIAISPPDVLDAPILNCRPTVTDLFDKFFPNALKDRALIY